jgi:hypothetical protein
MGESFNLLTWALLYSGCAFGIGAFSLWSGKRGRGLFWLVVGVIAILLFTIRAIQHLQLGFVIASAAVLAAEVTLSILLWTKRLGRSRDASNAGDAAP